MSPRLYCSPRAAIALAAILLAGCHSNPTTQPAAPNPPAQPPPTASAKTPASTLPTIRIKTGVEKPFTDNEGHVWLPDQGFADGDTVARDDDLPISNTTDPALYRTERYGMTSFSQKLPNGKYTVKLHFCETYSDGITGPGMRVFSYNVQGKEFKDLDLFAKTGGAQRAYVQSVPVDVTDGTLKITFTQNIENPEINGIEIIPAT